MRPTTCASVISDPGESTTLDVGRGSAEGNGQSHATPLRIDSAEVSEHCTGSRWIVTDAGYLAKIVAIIAMGQATHAARIINELLTPSVALDNEALKVDAKRRLSVDGSPQSCYHRDGLIFEAISWVAAQQETNAKTLIRDPHLSATTQGLDGLMIELDDTGRNVVSVTIVEDKCSVDPRGMFRDGILPAFKEYHDNNRASELVASAATLIQSGGLDGTAATKAAALVLDKDRRVYRGSLTVSEDDDSVARRKSIFKGYEQLQGLKSHQRIGATLVTSNDLRAWFDILARSAVEYVAQLGR